MDKKCPIEFTISLINGKWKIQILKELSHGPVRYGELERSVLGVSSKMLVQQLRELELDGLVEREVFPEVPPRVEYSLSEKGYSIFTIFLELRRWGVQADNQEWVSCKHCSKCQPLFSKYA